MVTATIHPTTAGLIVNGELYTGTIEEIERALDPHDVANWFG